MWLEQLQSYQCQCGSPLHVSLVTEWIEKDPTAPREKITKPDDPVSEYCEYVLAQLAEKAAEKGTAIDSKTEWAHHQTGISKGISVETKKYRYVKCSKQNCGKTIYGNEFVFFCNNHADHNSYDTYYLCPECTTEKVWCLLDRKAYCIYCVNF